VSPGYTQSQGHTLEIDHAAQAYMPLWLIGKVYCKVRKGPHVAALIFVFFSIVEELCFSTRVVDTKSGTYAKVDIMLNIITLRAYV
jgi:hypothetical protein